MGKGEVCRVFEHRASLLRCEIVESAVAKEGVLAVVTSGAGHAQFHHIYVVTIPAAASLDLSSTTAKVSKSATSVTVMPARESRRVLLAGEKRWSEVGAACGQECVVPAGEKWILDVDADVETLTINGELSWDTTVDGLTLKAGWVIAEGPGAVFRVGSEAAPMLKRATIHIKDIKDSDTGAAPFFSKHIHPTLGDRVLGGCEGPLHATDTATIRLLASARLVKTSDDIAPAGALVELHGRPLARTWTLLSRPAVAGASHIFTKHALGDMGWRAGDRIGIATTSEQRSTRYTIVAIEAAQEWELRVPSANVTASKEHPEWKVGSHRHARTHAAHTQHTRSTHTNTHKH